MSDLREWAAEAPRFSGRRKVGAPGKWTRYRPALEILMAKDWPMKAAVDAIAVRAGLSEQDTQLLYQAAKGWKHHGNMEVKA